MELVKLRLKCKACGYWNRFEVNKLFIEQPSSELKELVRIILFFLPHNEGKTPMFVALKTCNRHRESRLLL